MVNQPRTGEPLTSSDTRLAQLQRGQQEILSLLRQGVIPREELIYLEATTKQIAVGENETFDLVFQDIYGVNIPFILVSIVQVDIMATRLAVTDSVNLRLYLRARKRLPEDLIADFNGASQLSDTWYASFSNRRIDIRDLDNTNKLHGRATNTAGNSLPSPFIVRIYGRKML